MFIQLTDQSGNATFYNVDFIISFNASGGGPTGTHTAVLVAGAQSNASPNTFYVSQTTSDITTALAALKLSVSVSTSGSINSTVSLT